MIIQQKGYGRLILLGMDGMDFDNTKSILKNISKTP